MLTALPMLAFNLDVLMLADLYASLICQSPFRKSCACPVLLLALPSSVWSLTTVCSSHWTPCERQAALSFPDWVYLLLHHCTAKSLRR